MAKTSKFTFKLPTLLSTWKETRIPLHRRLKRGDLVRARFNKFRPEEEVVTIDRIGKPEGVGGENTRAYVKRSDGSVTCVRCNDLRRIRND